MERSHAYPDDAGPTSGTCASPVWNWPRSNSRPSRRALSSTRWPARATFRRMLRLLKKGSQAQDAVHDAVILAWQRWSSLRDRAWFDAWFDRIVVNVCRDRLRQASRRRTSDLVEASLSSPDATSEIHQRLLVEQAFARLRPDDVVVLALRHFLDLELADVAVLLDLPLQTVNTRLRSARSRLRDLLEQSSPDQVLR